MSEENVSFEGIKIDFDGKNPFNGIFAEMTRRCNGKNPHEKGKIKIIPSDNICNTYSHTIEDGFKSHWFTFVANPFLKFDFKENKVKINGYSLRTYSGEAGCAHLKSWDVEGSNDDKSWEIIQSIRDNEQLNDSKREAFWSITENDKSYRYIRIKMVGKSWANADFMVIRNIELFGSVEKI